jgi:hypothetical protein
MHANPLTIINFPGNSICNSLLHRFTYSNSGDSYSIGHPKLDFYDPSLPSLFPHPSLFLSPFPCYAYSRNVVFRMMPELGPSVEVIEEGRHEHGEVIENDPSGSLFFCFVSDGL